MEWAVDLCSAGWSEVARQVGRLGGTLGVVAGLLVSVVLALAITRDWRAPVFLVTAVMRETSICLATGTVVARGRPEVETLTSNVPPTSSFPSGHTAAALALWGGVALLVFAWHATGWGAS